MGGQGENRTIGDGEEIGNGFFLKRGRNPT